MMKLTTALLLAASGSVQVPPPPIIESFDPPSSSQQLVTWTIGEARCGGERQAVAHLFEPHGSIGWASPGAARAPVVFQFRIDADGRPLGVKRDGRPVPDNVTDLAPALVATRFAPGVARSDCTVAYQSARSPFAEADRSAVMAFTIFPGAGQVREAWDRIRPADSTCSNPAPGIRLRAFPDFEAIPETPGGTDWSMVGYDIDAKGRPVRLKIVAGSGNATLDRASAGAVKASRFAPGARTGCLYPYWRRGPALPAPVAPDVATLRPADATCPPGEEWNRKPVLRYPENYRARSIEGWAVVTFDVAPWGETGNLHVLAAEPSADFGEAALNVIRFATKQPSKAGATGCVQMVRFAMAAREPITDIPPSPAVY